MNLKNKFVSLSKFQTINEFLKTGFTKSQSEILYNSIVIKSHLFNLLPKKKDFENIKTDVQNLKQEINNLELKLLIKIGSMIGVAVSILAIIIKLK